MPAFPTLKTGAVAQYPASKTVCYSSRVVKFLDGTDQRYREYDVPRHKWLFPLTQLDQAELSALEQFFTSQSGQFSGFAFTDPWTQTGYPACSIDQNTLAYELTEEVRASSGIAVTENGT